MRRRAGRGDRDAQAGSGPVSHDDVYQAILESPAPSYWVLHPYGRCCFLTETNLPQGRKSQLATFSRSRCGPTGRFTSCFWER